MHSGSRSGGGTGGCGGGGTSSGSLCWRPARPRQPTRHPCLSPCRHPAGVLTEQFLKEQGVLLRGLAHPAIFSQSFGGSGGGSSGSDSEDEQRSGSEGSSSTTSGSGSGRSSGLPAWDPIQGFGDLLSGGGPSFNPLRSLLGSRGEGGGSGSSDGNASRSSASATDGRCVRARCAAPPAAPPTPCSAGLSQALLATWHCRPPPLSPPPPPPSCPLARCLLRFAGRHSGSS